uniref:Probable RNA-binding protein 18 n=1 Tax=Monopterus albus TaxID=43700 RepID=A0A3Q3K8D2_MONAL
MLEIWRWERPKIKPKTVENASIISESVAHDGNRLWIGNIDPKITEYHLVKLLEKFGTVKQFDFLFHKSGPLEGQPRGYCFVNFSTREEAERAIQCLNGKLALSKKLVVRLRNDKTIPQSLEPSSLSITPLVPHPHYQHWYFPLTSPVSPFSPSSTSAKIRAIEAKLQMMEENPDDEYSGPSAYVYNKPPERKRWEPYSKSHHNNQSRPFRKFRR